MIIYPTVKRRVLINGKFKNMVLYDFLTKWGTQNIRHVYYTEVPVINKRVVVFKDDNLFTEYNVLVTDIGNGLIKISL
jgi:hypothetical protein